MGKKTLLQSSQILESGCKKSHESWTYQKRLLVDIYDIFERGLSHVPSRTWDWHIESSSWLVCIPSGAYRWPWIRLGAIARCLNVGCIPKKLFHHSAIHREEHMAAVALGSSPRVPDRIYGNIDESRRVYRTHKKRAVLILKGLQDRSKIGVIFFWSSGITGRHGNCEASSLVTAT